MTKAEAIQALEAGKKVAHDGLCLGSVINLDGSTYEFDDGLRVDAYGFWRVREDDESWQAGWSIVD